LKTVRWITGLPPAKSEKREAEYASALRSNIGSRQVSSVTLLKEEDGPLGEERLELSKGCRVIRLGRRATFNDLLSVCGDGEVNCIANADVAFNFTSGRLRKTELGKSTVLALSRVDAPCKWSYDAWIFIGRPDVNADFELGRFSSDNAFVYLLKKSGMKVLHDDLILLRHYHESGEHSPIWNRPVMIGWSGADEVRRREGDFVTLACHECGGYRPGLGDQLCALSAAREYARHHPEHRCFISGIGWRLAETLFHDGLLSCGKPRGHLMSAYDPVRIINGCRTARNYLGFFYQSLGLTVDGPVRLELPRRPPVAGLPKDYIALQAYAVYAENPQAEFVQSVIDEAVRITGLPVIAVGKPENREGEPFRGVNYHFRSYLPIEMISIVQNSIATISGRSASAHIACATDVPLIYWCPSWDKMEWHLDGSSRGPVVPVLFQDEHVDFSAVTGFFSRILQGR